MDVFSELSLVILLATGVSLLMRVLRQPLIVGHILTGLIAGPYFLNILKAQETLEVLSKLGITALLFIVGLSLSPLIIREVGKVSLITGLGQIIFTSLFGYLILTALGFNTVTSVYLAVALTFSSTIIILKLLTDKGDAEKLYGKIAIGFLLVQDIVAALILVLIPPLAQAQGGQIAGIAVQTLTIGLGTTVVLFLFSRFFLSKLSAYLARSTELLFLFSIAWGMGLATVFRTLGFSLEIGALLAGITLSATPYSQEVASRVKPIRDLFIVLFFILLGSQLQLGGDASYLMPTIILSLFVIVGNPFIVFVLMNLLGHTRRNSFRAGLTVAQISEFSLILVALGQQVGHLDPTAVTITTLVGMATISVSTYLIIYEEKIYPKIEGWLRYFEIRRVAPPKTVSQEKYDTILFGFHRVGQDFVEAFKDLKRNFLVVDFDPDSIKILEKAGIRYRYGDADDAEFLDELNLGRVGLIVSTVPDLETNLLIAEKAKKKNPAGVVIVVSHTAQEAKELYQAGATYVIMPHYLGAQTAAKLIVEHDTKEKMWEPLREKHLKYLEKRTI